MFIEKLSDDDIRAFVVENIQDEFIQEYCSVNRYGSECSVFLRLKNGALSCVSFNDFNIGADMESVCVENLKLQWKKFMHQKFGDKYKQAFNENLKRKYESEMIK